MQSKKIVDLMAQAQEGGGSVTTEKGAEVEALKLKLFEAEAELAAVKERLLSSTSFEEPPTPKTQVTHEAVPDEELQRRAEELQTKLHQAELSASQFQGKVSELEGICSTLRSENEDAAAQIATLTSALAALEEDKSRSETFANERATQQQVEAREAWSKLEVAEQRILELERSLAEFSRTASTASPDTHESSASGVRVEAPTSLEHASVLAVPSLQPVPSPAAAPPAAGAPEQGEEGSDWGDDW
jgi:chromosome segregation ATPase